jgi:glutathione S-transferase
MQIDSICTACLVLRHVASFALQLKWRAKMIVYGSAISPFVRKVLVFAAEKGLEIELQPGGMGQGGDAFKLASPFGKMPGFEDGDYRLSDSSAIVHYLDAAYPSTPLIPADAKLRGRVVWFDEAADTILMAAGGKIFFNRIVGPKFLGMPGDEAIAAQGEAELPPVFDYLEGALPASGHFVGDALSLADISVAAMFVNLDHLGIKPDAATHPKLAAFVTAMHARPSFAKWIAIERKALGAG